jgi:hypothetical protein
VRPAAPNGNQFSHHGYRNLARRPCPDV